MNVSEKFGIIGGTALAQNMRGFRIIEEGWFQTKHWGEVWLVKGEIAGHEVFFVPRHGKGHKNPPHRVNYVGNLVALKMNGVTTVLAASAMGALDQKYTPGHLVFVKDVTDRTEGRQRTFFDKGIACHVALSQAVCPHLHERLMLVASDLEIPYQPYGKLVVINGPHFSTVQESGIYRAEGHHVVGMTGSPEFKIARDLEMHYAIIGQVTDYDNPPPGLDVEPVDQKVISARLAKVGGRAARVIHQTIFSWSSDEPSCNCCHSLDGSILTAPEEVDSETRLQICDAFGVEEIPQEWFAGS